MNNILKTLSIGLILSSTVCWAGGNGMDMEKMMQQAEAAQACFENIDESKLMALEKEGRKMEQEINALCKAGKSAQATKKAIAYGLKMQSDPSFKQIQGCAKQMAGIMPMPQPYMPKGAEDTSGATSVCD